jgi:hypothetical protein
MIVVLTCLSPARDPCPSGPPQFMSAGGAPETPRLINSGACRPAPISNDNGLSSSEIAACFVGFLCQSEDKVEEVIVLALE